MAAKHTQSDLFSLMFSAIFSRSLCFILIHLHDSRCSLAFSCMSDNVSINLRNVVAATAARCFHLNACAWAPWRSIVTSAKHQQSTELFFFETIATSPLFKLQRRKIRIQRFGFFWSAHSSSVLHALRTREMHDLHIFHLSHACIRSSYALGGI